LNETEKKIKQEFSKEKEILKEEQMEKLAKDHFNIDLKKMKEKSIAESKFE